MIIFTDNADLVSIINKQTSLHKVTMGLVRTLVSAMQCNVVFHAEHIPGKHNVIADCVSHCQVEKARLHGWTSSLIKSTPLGYPGELYL